MINVDMLDLSKFKTGIKLEREFNRIVTLARAYKISHIEADRLLDEIYDYGRKENLFTKKDHQKYLKRQNFHPDGRPRTHLDFALNLSRGQAGEHDVFLYFLKWSKRNIVEEEREERVKWDFNGSDLEGYIIIVDFSSRRKCVEPDYKLIKDKTTRLIESKSFKTVPFFKELNLLEYLREEAKGTKVFLVFRYLGRYYMLGSKAIRKILRMEKSYSCGQNVIEVSQKCIDDFLEKKIIKEIINVE